MNDHENPKDLKAAMIDVMKRRWGDGHLTMGVGPAAEGGDRTVVAITNVGPERETVLLMSDAFYRKYMDIVRKRVNEAVDRELSKDK
jgi:hypothetical protein